MLRTDGLCNQLGQDVFLIMFWDGGDDGSQRRNIGKLVLLGQLGTQRVEVDISRGFAVFGCLVILNQGVGNIGAASKESLTLGRKFSALLLRHRDRRRGHGSGGHGRAPWVTEDVWRVGSVQDGNS